ncbi:hypothetical protein NCCP1664_21850 [Zafaria cholistanensis]|uniref:Uncharacterized protein n=1 Tax=Zafaria cholistanensis TaxID=1682741 RepID=A0A5A7NSA0_9MICC|nr:hypothetical protein [Zafaria cholistanensis]GER23690.1 hypothetical protein NCCP1664_21850 [Zafaria cholistanensis]
MQSLGSNPGTPSNGAPGKSLTLSASTLSLAVMVTVFLVAVVFAANQNDVIGWFVVIISLGWLLLSAFLVFGLRRGAKAVGKQLQQATVGLAARGDSSAPVVVNEATSARDLKLDHSFKIVLVQAGVIKEYLPQEGAEAREMVARALETIEITASNARDLMKPSGGAKPMSGEIID